MKKAILITILILILVAVGWVVDLLWSAGQFKTITPHGRMLIGSVFESKFLDCQK
jgi:hypothetical protein